MIEDLPGADPDQLAVRAAGGDDRVANRQVLHRHLAARRQDGGVAQEAGYVVHRQLGVAGAILGLMGEEPTEILCRIELQVVCAAGIGHLQDIAGGGPRKLDR
jgi:hypothetical protein